MKRSSYLIILTIIIVSSGLFFACRKNDQSDLDKSAPPQRKLKVAVLLPLTGPAASGGVASKEGFELAIEDIRAKHGDNIEVAFEDTESNPTRAVTIYQQVTAAHSSQVVVLELSSVTKAIKPLLNRSVLAVATAVAIPDVADPSIGLFRVFPTSQGVAHTAVEHAIGAGQTNAAIIYVNDDYGLGSMNSFKSQFENRGGKIILAEPFSLLEKDFRVQWAKILKENPGCVWITGYGPGYLSVLNQLRETSYQGIIMTDWSLSSPDYMQATEGVRDGTIVVMPESSPDLADRYTKRHGKEGFMVNVGYSYDTLMMTWAAFQASDGSATNLLTKFQSTKSHKGAMGEISILDSGDSSVVYTARKVANKKLVPLRE